MLTSFSSEKGFFSFFLWLDTAICKQLAFSAITFYGLPLHVEGVNACLVQQSQVSNLLLDCGSHNATIHMVSPFIVLLNRILTSPLNNLASFPDLSAPLSKCIQSFQRKCLVFSLVIHHKQRLILLVMTVFQFLELKCTFQWYSCLLRHTFRIYGAKEKKINIRLMQTVPIHPLSHSQTQHLS